MNESSGVLGQGLTAQPLTLQEHRQLMAAVTHLSDVASRGSEDTVRWCGEVRRVLRYLRPELDGRYCIETDDSQVAEFLSKFPHLSCRLDDLRTEHLAMVDRADALLSRTARPTSRRRDVVRLRHGVQELVEQVRHHDASECELVIDAVTRDIGVGD